MIQPMESLYTSNFEDFAEEEYGSLSKRSRLAAAPPNQQLSSGSHMFAVPPSLYNPLDEPSPLGLRLRKSPSLLDLIQMRLSQGSSASISMKPTEIADKKNVKGSASTSVNDKLKASNFQASFLRIGNWEYVSRYDSDLVAKCYFAKHKLVWEVLESGLKSKIEIQWSDITALKADFPDDGPGALTIVLARQPSFFRETNPQPRKHTLWQATTDFTNGQASLNKKHCIQFPPGVLNKHYEKLIQCDMRLNILSQHPEIVADSLFFESEASACENSEQSEVMDTQAIEGNTSCDERDSVGPKNRESSKLPGLPPSMSMSDLVHHIGNCLSEQRISGSLPREKASKCQDMLDNIAQDLLSDTNFAMGLDEMSLMKKVNSLCSLLQDPAMAQVDGENCFGNVGFDLVDDSTHKWWSNTMQGHEGNFGDGGLPRRDSLGDLLLHLPRIASLPKFQKLFGN